MSDRVPEPEVWTARLRTFVHDCIASPPCEEVDRVREAAILLRCGTACMAGRKGIDPNSVEAMLACGATASAVMAMLDPETVFMLSRGQGNSCLATVIAAHGVEEVLSEGSTLALALLAAYAGALLAGIESDGDGARACFPRTFPRLH